MASSTWRALAVLTIGLVGGCSGSARSCETLASLSCRIEIVSDARRDPAGARARFRATTGRMAQRCAALLSGTSVPPPASDDVLDALSVSAAAQDCVALASLRLGASSGRLRHPAEVRAVDASAPLMDWRQTLDALALLCDRDGAGRTRSPRIAEVPADLARNACQMLGELHAAGSVTREPTGAAARYHQRACVWAARDGGGAAEERECIRGSLHPERDARDAPTLATREAAARAALEQLRQVSEGDRDARRVAAERFADLVDGVDSPAFVALRSASGGELGQAALEEAATHFAALDAALAASDEDALITRFVAARAFVPPAPNPAREALLRRWHEALGRAIQDRIGRHEFTLALALLAVLGDRADPPQVAAWRAAIEATSASEELQRGLAALEALGDPPRWEPALHHRFVRAHTLLRRVDPALRGSFEARWSRLLERAVERLVARHWYGPADRLLSAVEHAGEPSARRAAVRAEAAQFHAGLFAAHRAARRPVTAWFHAALARHFGGAADSTALTAAVSALRPPTLRAVSDGAACAFMGDQPASEAAAERPTLVVHVRWSRCESTDRRWTTTAEHNYTTRERVTRRTRGRFERVPGSPAECRTVSNMVGTLGGPTGNGMPVQTSSTACTGGSAARLVWVEDTEEVLVDVPHTERRETQHRELITAATAEVTVVAAGQTLRLPFDAAEPTISEEQYRSPQGDREFSAQTLDEQRARLRDRFWLMLRSGGAVHAEVTRVEAQRLEAAARRASAPLAAEEAYGRLVLVTGRAEPAADAFFSARYGIEGDELAHVIDRGEARPARGATTAR